MGKIPLTKTEMRDINSIRNAFKRLNAAGVVFFAMDCDIFALRGDEETPNFNTDTGYPNLDEALVEQISLVLASSGGW